MDVAFLFCLGLRLCGFVSDLGAELMRLQGIDFPKPFLAEYSENQVTDLAGNAPL